ncbi:ArsR family transcriptional regulator [Halorubrum yunnanense]|uniref:ArsR family transcriptional regulator n=1 Tax=Halorubrum yunnanense TaxID=1526162 RepID=A0ABD5YFR5_9EURY|nr:ArsR family transcriptional regulator [Halorubrum yunnanense]
MYHGPNGQVNTAVKITEVVMRQLNTTDLEVLTVLAEGGRNVSPNIAVEIDKNRAYLNTRVLMLLDYDLVTRVGPSKNSGLYEITEKGQIVVEYRDQFDPQAKSEFTELIDAKYDG